MPMPPGITTETRVYLLYRDGYLTDRTEMNDPDFWQHRGEAEDILIYQVEGEHRNVAYWDRLTQHVEQFQMIVPRLDDPDAAELTQDWSDTRKQLYQVVQMGLFARWLEAFKEMERS